MLDDVYDATFIHKPEQSDVEIDGEIQCLSCDEKFFPDMTDEVLDEAVEGAITAPVDCPDTTGQNYLNALAGRRRVRSH